ncbi:hypothetical protein GN956_G10237 [Arapaima gigas]
MKGAIGVPGCCLVHRQSARGHRRAAEPTCGAAMFFPPAGSRDTPPLTGSGRGPRLGRSSWFNRLPDDAPQRKLHVCFGVV